MSALIAAVHQVIHPDSGADEDVGVTLHRAVGLVDSPFPQSVPDSPKDERAKVYATYESETPADLFCKH